MFDRDKIMDFNVSKCAVLTISLPTNANHLPMTQFWHIFIIKVSRNCDLASRNEIFLTNQFLILENCAKIVQKVAVRLVCASVLHWAISVPATLGKDVLSTRDYTMNGHAIPRRDKPDYLGVTIDPKLSWKDHISRVCGKDNIGPLPALA